MKYKKIIFLILLCILMSIFLNRKSFTSYFFQDDWFSFRISKVNNISDFFKFFIPRTDVIYYRPLGMQIPFFMIDKLFGISEIPFRVLTLITHIINTFLVYYLVLLILKRNSYSILTAFLYSTSTVFYIPFFWSATYAFMLGPMFFFLTMIFYIRYVLFKRPKLLIYSLLSFIFGIFTYETIAVLPLVICIYLYAFGLFKKRFITLIPFIFIILIFLSLRFLLFKPPTTGVYTLGINHTIVNNLKGYILWSFNWPEEMKAQFISFFRINPDFIRDFPFYYYIFTATFVINILLFYIIPFILYFFNKYKISFPILTSGVLWFVTGLLPVLFFSQHSFSYYLPVSLVGLLIPSVYLYIKMIDYISKNFGKIYSVTILLLPLNWIVCSYFTIEFNSKVHWAPKRAKLSYNLIKENYRNLYENKIFIHNTSENRLALNNEDAFKAIIGENILTIYDYEKK